MRFERPLKGVVATSLAAFALSACGSASKIEPITVPEGTINMGFGYDSNGDYGRNFRLNDQQVRLVNCGSINGDPATKDIQPAGDGTSQVNCSVDSLNMPDASDDDVTAYRNLSVHYARPQ